MATMNFRALARAAALGLSSLAACSSPSHPSADLGDEGRDGGSVHDSGGDAAVHEAGTTEAEALDAVSGDVAASLESSADGGSPDVGASDDSGSETGTESLPPALSCATPGAGVSDCANDAGSCCASLEVAAGHFTRSYDGVSSGYTTQSAPVAVSAFRLDQYEITVGRFRQFVAAAIAGWMPSAGSGKHVHLNDGKGLIDSSSPSMFEAGWDASWNVNLGTTTADWNTKLACDPTSATWTVAAGSNETLPIDCVTWFDSYAFCIWDGGFLPSEAEWNYAASGGSDQRVYPWSSPPVSTTIDCTYANYFGGSGGTDFCVMPGVGATNAVGSESPMGDGKWGQSDLAGNVFEWNLDAFAPYGAGYPDSAYLATAPFRVIRGGDFESDDSFLLTSSRRSDDPTDRSVAIGARCARIP
jgi:formylglycine-generating enzyme required for sulfatase activity